MSELRRYWVKKNHIVLSGGRKPQDIDVILDHAAIDNYCTVYKADDVARVLRMFLQDFIAKNAIGSKDRDAGVYLCGQCGNPYGANIALLECQHDKDCLILEAQRLLKELEP